MTVRLDEFNADEWFDVAKKFKPRLSREEFDRDWAEFQREKAERLQRMARH
jgi:hypothetical protein